MPLLERLKRWLLSETPARPDNAASTVAAPTAVHPDAAEPAGLLVIDVRSEREFQTTAIERAVNVPLPQLAHRIGELAADKARPLVLYCASGARSGVGCGVLQQMGYTRVTNAGGLYAAADHLQREVRR